MLLLSSNYTAKNTDNPRELNQNSSLLFCLYIHQLGVSILIKYANISLKVALNQKQHIHNLKKQSEKWRCRNESVHIFIIESKN